MSRAGRNGILASATLASVTAMTFVASSTSTGTSITIPAGAQAGDIAVIAHYGIGWPNFKPFTITGWTLIDEVDGGDQGGAWYVKKLVSGDPGSSVTVGVSATRRTICAVWRPNAAVASITAFSKNIETTDGNPASQTVTCSSETHPHLVLGMYANNATSFGSARTFSPGGTEIANTGTSGGCIYLKWEDYGSADLPSSNTTVDMADEGTNNVLMSCGLRIQ